MQKVVLATGNPGKLAEMQTLLSPLGMTVIPQKQFFTEEAVENGLTFIENALIKARFASEKNGLPAIADDSGLEVDALGGMPGIYSARYSEGDQGLPASDERNNRKLLAELAHFERQNRQACYYCAMVYLRHPKDPTPVIGIGKWCGTVLNEPRGTGGFRYDPIIWMPDLKASVAELTKTIKNQHSHRAQAIQQLVTQLKQ